MNRALLLIICDFLLLSLLALARFDEPLEQTPEEPERPPIQETAKDDLVETLKLALDAEVKEREEMADKLEEKRIAVIEREEEAEKVREELKSKEERLEMAQSEIIHTQRSLEEQMDTLRKLQEENAERLARQRLLQEKLQERDEKLEQAQEEIAQLSKERLRIEGEKQRIETELKIRQTEKDLVEQRLVATRAELDTVKVEKTEMTEHAKTLAEGVNKLADSQKEITEDIKREIKTIAQPISSNRIFQDFQDNKVVVRFSAEQKGLFGKMEHSYESPSVFVKNENGVYALFHAQDTPFRDGAGGRLESVKGQLEAAGKKFNIKTVSFLQADPRILAIAVPPDFPDQIGLEAFAISKDPLRFPKAVLIGSREGYYGECAFKVDPWEEDILLMEQKLFGGFSPSRSDMVYVKTGEFLGFMLNSKECQIISGFAFSKTVPIGDSFNAEQTAALLKELNKRHN